MISLEQSGTIVPITSGCVHEPALLVAEHLLDKNREEIQRADGKVSMLVVGALTSGALVMQWMRGHVTQASHTGQWLVGAGLALWLMALVMLAATVYPRVGTKQETRAATYFADVHRAAEMSMLWPYVRQAAENRLAWLLAQVADTSGIVVAKYRYLRVAICLLGLGCALAGIGVAL